MIILPIQAFAFATEVEMPLDTGMALGMAMVIVLDGAPGMPIGLVKDMDMGMVWGMELGRALGMVLGRALDTDD